ncbi:uncharacterized protein BCR38DRAFT_109876 [Pseudomassariella vexata]|uniref:Uncharacterized protein n=1 Tax=Pseudomassariella vexata TaxID=1141098 RepID=A0A1Y2DD71_9PEZI|nr:uncharacterized protein BCR38DRAFT_109876 [Pseudomassariella vexata]ORY57233.1 hypothetical protein BCR38DRAFT_109876 [Pseudomassariella vexata]
MSMSFLLHSSCRLLATTPKISQAAALYSSPPSAGHIVIFCEVLHASSGCCRRALLSSILLLFTVQSFNSSIRSTMFLNLASNP